MDRTILTITISSSLCWAMLEAPLALADNLSEARNSIQSMYTVKNKAAERKDVSGMMSIYAPDFTITYPNGRVINRSELQQETEKMLPSVKSVVSHDLVDSVSLKGDTALVQSSRNSTSISDNAETHKPDRIVLNAKVDEVWVKVGKKWLLKKSRVVSASVTVNGKPMTAR